MSIEIKINNSIIDFPTSAQSPNWAPALIEFAQNTADALDGISGEFDISPLVVDIVNTGVETAITSPSGAKLSFSTNDVRAAFIRYSIYRKDSTGYSHAETGLLSIVYNPDGTGGSKWETQREFTGNKTPEGSAGGATSGVLFRVDDSGQVYYTAVPIFSDAQYFGKLSVAAQALAQI